MQRRDYLQKRYIKAKDEVTKENYHNSYKQLRNQIVSLCRESKKKYFQKYFIDNANNIRNTWKGIKSIISINNKTNYYPSTLTINNKVTTDPTKIANEFNDYFSNIAENLQEKIFNTGNHFTEYLKDRNEHSFFINPTDKYELIDTINNSINNKASGPHSIPNDIIHLIKFIIAEPLSDIINHSFNSGKYIDILKISKTIPTYKNKGSKLECNNYRPISLLSNINKIFEKIMYKRLYDFLEHNNCIFRNQFGFRAHHSTIHALISITEDVRQALDANNIACGVFIDLQKAFDTVDHEILLRKLQYYGIRGTANDWFQSYLINRKQYVTINGYDSKIVNMHYGVPQGSVLGPLLFLIYINDLHTAIKFSTTRHFADDTNLLIKNKSPKQLQKQLNIDLGQLCKWLKANKISLNASKTELIIFKHPNKPINYDLKIKINGKRLYPSKFVKYLGIFIDSHLNWNYQSEALSTKLSRAVGMLAKIRHYVPVNTLRSIYHGIFSSLLTYGSQIWGQFNNKYISRLEKLQNRAIRVINFANNKDHITPLYNKSKILKLSDNIKLQNFNLVLDSIKGNLPKVLQDTFKLTQNLHTYNTRGASLYKMAVPKVRTQIYGIKSIKYQSIQFWNYMVGEFPEKTLHLKSKSVCKKIIYDHFMQMYNQT